MQPSLESEDPMYDKWQKLVCGHKLKFVARLMKKLLQSKYTVNSNFKLDVGSFTLLKSKYVKRDYVNSKFQLDVENFTSNFIRKLEIPNSNFKFQREIQSEFQNSSHSEKGPIDLSYVPLIIRYAETPKIEF